MTNLDAAIKILLREELKYTDPPASIGAAIAALRDYPALKLERDKLKAQIADYMKHMDPYRE